MAVLFDSISKMLGVAIRGTILRQNVIANNISNADTPNYQAMDVKFDSLLRHVMEEGIDDADIDLTPKPHSLIKLAGLDDSRDSVELVYETESNDKLDDNTVDIDREMTKLAQNQISHHAFVKLLNAKFNMLKTAINGRQ